MPRLSKKVALHTDPRFQDIVKRTFYAEPPFYYIPSGKRNVYCAPHCKARSAQKIKQIVNSSADAEALGYERCQRCRGPPPEIKLLMALHYIQQHPEDNLKNITTAVGWSRAHGHRYIRHLTMKTPKQLCAMTKSGIDIVSYYNNMSKKPDMFRHLDDQLHQMSAGGDVSITPDAVGDERQTSSSPRSTDISVDDTIVSVPCLSPLSPIVPASASIASGVQEESATPPYLSQENFITNCASIVSSQDMEFTFSNMLDAQVGYFPATNTGASQWQFPAVENDNVYAHSEKISEWGPMTQDFLCQSLMTF